MDEEYLQQIENEIIVKDEPNGSSNESGANHYPFTFIDFNESKNDVKHKSEDVVLKDHPYTISECLDQQSMDSLNLINEDEDVNETFIIEEVFEEAENDQSRSKKQHHKTHQLTGKAACKYCETVFKNKELKNAHECKYLQCDPRNFICRVCGKELSRKTFSNHLHETLDCQYCLKSFVNPRNLKTHIMKLHTTEEYIEPRSPKYKPLDLVTEDIPEHLDEETGLIVPTAIVKEKKPRKRYPRKTGRYECDLCGRILKTSTSLNQHFLLHSQIFRYVCEVS